MPSGCNYFDTQKCRSCSLLELSYEAQLKQKHAVLSRLFAEHLPDSPAPKALVASSPAFGSRNKAKLAVAGSAAQPILGFPSSSGDVTEVLECPLHVPILNVLARRVKQLITKYHIPPYSITKRNGELKYILMRVSESTDQIMLRAVLRSPECAGLIEKLWSDLKAEFPQLIVGSVNIQPEPKAIVEGLEEQIFSQQKFLEDSYGPYKLHFSPQTFSQVTSNIAFKLYSTASAWISSLKSEAMLDLYCGAGAFSFFALKHVKTIMGVEGSPSAIEDARRAASLQNFPQLRFECADVQQFLTQHNSRYDLVLLNPPRRGAEKEAITFIKNTLPKDVIYSSCNPVTLVRDLKELAPNYRITEIQPFDMFPLTPHMEVLVQLRQS